MFWGSDIVFSIFFGFREIGLFIEWFGRFFIDSCMLVGFVNCGGFLVVYINVVVFRVCF